MKKVTGRFKEYSLAKKAGVAGDGEIYLIKDGESEGLCAKLLSDRTKQAEVEAYLQGAGYSTLADIPIDIIFSRGKFAGYIYQDYDAWNQAPDPGRGKNPMSGGAEAVTLDTGYTSGSSGYIGGGSDSSTGRSGGADNPLVRFGILGVGAVLLALLNIKVFHSIFLNFVENMFSPEVLAGCRVLGFSGMTAVVIGLAVAGLLYTHVSGMDTPVFLTIELGSFLAGILLTDVLIVVIIQLVMGVVSLLLAVLPVLVLAVVVIALVKSIFKK